MNVATVSRDNLRTFQLRYALNNLISIERFYHAEAVYYKLKDSGKTDAPAFKLIDVICLTYRSQFPHRDESI